MNFEGFIIDNTQRQIPRNQTVVSNSELIYI
jgi:hypothetical protein